MRYPDFMNEIKNLEIGPPVAVCYEHGSGGPVRSLVGHIVENNLEPESGRIAIIPIVDENETEVQHHRDRCPVIEISARFVISVTYHVHNEEEGDEI